MKIRIPATSANLGPGFDSLGLALAMYNEVTITPSSQLEISIEGEGSDRNRLKKSNPFVDVFYEIYCELSGKKDNFKFEFLNVIPFSRGLGSSSAVVIGAIASAYHMARFKVDKDIVVSKALRFESHPDNIAPATYGGFICAIISEGRVIKIRKELPQSISAVVVIPDRAMSTQQSRSFLPKHYNIADTIFNISRSSLLSAAFMSENWEVLNLASQDKIHEDRRMSQMKELFDVRRIALQNGALMSTLSGSGSTFFNLVYKKNSANLAQALKRSFKEFKVLELEFDNSGFEIIDE